MNTLADIAVLIVALLHLSFLVLEMFLWNTPHGHKIFGLKPEFAASTQKLAANQGLYNGFIAAGLFWSLIASYGYELKLFFLGCVIIAGIYGGLTTSRPILGVQAMPGIIALVLVFLAQS